MSQSDHGRCLSNPSSWAAACGLSAGGSECGWVEGGSGVEGDLTIEEVGTELSKLRETDGKMWGELGGGISISRNVFPPCVSKYPLTDPVKSP